MIDELIEAERDLKNPTVQQVIDYLSQFPADAPFRIEDPDTNWTINIIHATCCAGIVWFTGHYHEMNFGPENASPVPSTPCGDVR